MGKKTSEKATLGISTTDKVDFYLSSVVDKNKLGTVDQSGGKFTLEITLTGDKWNAGEKIIIAVYGGSGNIKGTALMKSQGQATLTVTGEAPIVPDKPDGGTPPTPTPSPSPTPIPPTPLRRAYHRQFHRTRVG